MIKKLLIAIAAVITFLTAIALVETASGTSAENALGSLNHGEADLAELD